MAEHDADALTEAQRDELVAALHALKGALPQQIAMTADGARPVDLDQPIGRVSRIDAIQQQSMIKANRAAARRRLGQVNAALIAVDEDEYGNCRRCDEPIGYPRLKARPETPLCLDCQGRAERS